MYLLSNRNTLIDTDKVNHEDFYSVLSFKDYKNPDFYFREFLYLECFKSDSLLIEIGKFNIIVPLHWSILCCDVENVKIESIPLYDLAGIGFSAFCLNPIDGYIPQYNQIRMLNIYTDNEWYVPPIEDKDMLVIPLDYEVKEEGKVEKGPICAIFSPNKMEVNRPMADIL